jgi:hypothetical protein
MFLTKHFTFPSVPALNGTFLQPKKLGPLWFRYEQVSLYYCDGIAIQHPCQAYTFLLT